jgi:SAM-dependent methyltransferase
VKEMSESEVKFEFPLSDLIKELLPNGYELLPGVNQIYELELALAEYRSLTKEDLIRRSAYFYKVDGIETFHSKLCTGVPLKIDKSTSVRLRTFFQVYQFKTGYATHGLFPYRGKFHPQLIKAIMNIIGLKVGDVVLDPMTGSGTTNIEASILGIDSIGIEASPFCCLMAKAKADALRFDSKELRKLAQKPDEIFEHYHRKKRVKLSEYMDREEGCRFAWDVDPAYDNFFKLCYLDAMGYARRRKMKSIEELFPTVLDKYVSAVLNFISIREKLGLKLGKVIICEGDARDLQKIDAEDINRIGDESIDGIITSPPYSFAIDYLEGDRLQLEYMGYEIEKLREKMIGLRGRTMIEKVQNYLLDMDKAISEMSRVLRRGRYCVIVIGSNVIQLQRTLENKTNVQNFGLEGLDANMRLEDALVKIGEKHNLKLVKRLSRPIEGIQNIMRTEEILFLRKK